MKTTCFIYDGIRKASIDNITVQMYEWIFSQMLYSDIRLREVLPMAQTYCKQYGDIRAMNFVIGYCEFELRYEHALKYMPSCEIEKYLSEIKYRFDGCLEHSCKRKYKITICQNCYSWFYTGNLCRCVQDKIDRQRQSDTISEGLVYFIRASDRVKIGYVQKNCYSAIENRLATIKTGIPFSNDEIEIIWHEPGGQKREHDLHVIFSSDRIRHHGEWFYYSDRIKNYIEESKRRTA